MPTRPRNDSRFHAAGLLAAAAYSAHNGRCSLCHEQAEVVDARLFRANHTIIAGQLCELCLEAFLDLFRPSHR